jgi:uncharacterized membrane protein YkvI
MRELHKFLATALYIALAIIVAITILTVSFLLASLASCLHPLLGYVVFAGVFLIMLNCILRELKYF